MTAHEFMQTVSVEDLQAEIQKGIRVKEAMEDAYYEAVGALIEQHPIRNPMRLAGRPASAREGMI